MAAVAGARVARRPVERREAQAPTSLGPRASV